MSSKRGRKRNDNLPPNRARDVQRAFRARRAAHLQAMEERVAELEEENDRLRAALNLPPANRQPLGKGPTGKDRAKPYPSRPSSSSNPNQSGDGGARASRAPSSADESASSTRAPSVSPSALNNSLRPSPQSLDTGSWGLLQAAEESTDGPPGPSPASTSFSQTSPVSSSFPQASPASTSFTSPVSTFSPSVSPATPSFPQSASGASYSLAAPSAQKAPQSYNFPAQMPHTSRTHPGGMFLQSMAQSYGQTADRQLPNFGSAGMFLRDESQQHSYTQSPLSPGHDQSSLHNHHSSNSSSLQQGLAQRDAPAGMHTGLPYVQRRSITEPQGFRTLNHGGYMGTPQTGLHGIRLSPPPRAADGGGDARLNPM